MKELPGSASPPSSWESELFILRDSDRDRLKSRVERLGRWVEHNTDVNLKDLAFTLNSRLEPRGSRLAVVASSAAELKSRLEQAATRLGDPKCQSIRIVNGTYWFDKPLHPEGKLALLFPGENAQYLHMFADLMPHFPEVRDWFQWADNLVVAPDRQNAEWSRSLSGIVFPPPHVPEADAEQRLRLLHHAIPAVMVANFCLLMLLKQLGLWVDCVAGHSAGEFSALGAAGCFDASYHQLRETAEAMYDLECTPGGPEAVLYAVGAGQDRLQDLLALPRLAGRAFVGMDNCPHQSVLVAAVEDHEFIAAELEKRRLPAERVPYRRPHHTHLVEPLLGPVRKSMQARKIRLPHTQVWSCTTARPFPDDPEALGRLAVEQWMKPVRFTEMIRAMHDDGVKLFVECGPRGNLTGFVDDILRGLDFAAVAANVQRRAGVTQLNHMAGLLAAHHVPLHLDYFYVRRQPRKIVWDATAAPPAPLSPEYGGEGSGVRGSGSSSAGSAQTIGSPSPLTPDPSPPEYRGRGEQAGAAVSLERTALMAEYTRVMEQFLDVQREVMEAFLNDAPTAGPEAPPARPAMIDEVISLEPGRELVARHRLDLNEDLFAADHTLGGRGASSVDPTHHGQPVMPMTFSMEIMAEAATLLFPGKVVVGMRRVRLARWIVFDETPGAVTVTARVVEPEGDRERVLVSLQQEGDSQAAWAAEGTVLLADRHPEPPPPEAFPLTNERPALMTTAQLYEALIHGPLLQAVCDTGRVGDGGVEGKLKVLPHAGLFRSNANPGLLIDPVLLDASTHLLGVWHLNQADLSGRVLFPVEVGAADWYGPPPSGGEVICRVRVEGQTTRTVRHGIDLLYPDGRLWCRLAPLDYWRFYMPFYRCSFLGSKDQYWLGEEWPELAGGDERVCGVRVGLLSDLRPGVMRDAMARMCLSRSEWPQYRNLKEREPECTAWLFRRIAAKEAIRRLWLRPGYDALHPADLHLEPAGAERFRVEYRGNIPRPRDLPSVAATFADGTAYAVAAFDLVAELPAADTMTAVAVAEETR